MSKKNLEVRISQRSVQGSPIWEGTVSISGTRPTKLVRRSNNTTSFATRSAVLTSARTLAKTLGYAGVTEPTLALKAAKKSNKKTSSTPSKTTSKKSSK
jgi:hypothetical protein